MAVTHSSSLAPSPSSSFILMAGFASSSRACGNLFRICHARIVLRSCPSAYRWDVALGLGGHGLFLRASLAQEPATSHNRTAAGMTKQCKIRQHNALDKGDLGREKCIILWNYGRHVWSVSLNILIFLSICPLLCTCSCLYRDIGVDTPSHRCKIELM